MSDYEQEEQEHEELGSAEDSAKSPSNGNGNARKAALTAAAIAAASGATAFAAKKALSSSTGSSSRQSGSAGGDETEDGEWSGDDRSAVMSSMLVSGWHAAKDSLLPVAEEAASAAGEYVARHSPDIVRDTIVPKFISGFESARDSDA